MTIPNDTNTGNGDSMSTEQPDLVARLRSHAERLNDAHFLTDAVLMCEAADEILRLREALKPFAKAAAAPDFIGTADKTVMFSAWARSDGRVLIEVHITARDLRRAARALLSSHQDQPASSPKPDPVPVDRSAIQLSGGGEVTDDHRELKDNGQQKGYIVLTAAERAKGFVRPYRDTYRHLTCGAETRMSSDIAETYARDPGFYSGTFCATCRGHFPVGPDGEFVWRGTNEKVGT
jgi:hypothetical protein